MLIMTTARRGLVIGSFLMLMLLLFPVKALAANEENTEVSRLLQDARDDAAVLSRDADEMEALTRTDVSWQTHASMLETVKDHVNQLARVTEQLQAKRSMASPWQQQAIDRMMPLLKELATNTTAAINHLKDHKTRPTSGSYPEYLKQNAETSHALSDMVSSFVRYDHTRAKLERLEQRLEIATN